MLLPFYVTSLLLGVSEASKLQKRAVGTATVSIAEPSGIPSQIAAGFIYGIPDNGEEVSTQIPSNYYKDIGFQWTRSGGAQLREPNRGWGFNETEYFGRFQSALSNYRTAIANGGKFILLPHDIWGADTTNVKNIAYPGDGGDWSSYERFLNRLIADMKANGMIKDAVIDIWNEPEISNFWDRPFDQYLELWTRSYRIYRDQIPEVPTSGPSLAASPKLDDQNWVKWTEHVARDDVVPQIYSWHAIGGNPDPVVDLGTWNTFRARHGFPEAEIHINEYAWPEEQTPSTSAWYISRLEEANTIGLRANWAAFGELHDYLANLLGKAQDGSYYPNGEWWLYNYYAKMTGQRLATDGSANGRFAVFATRDVDTVKIIAGNRQNQDTNDIKVTGLTSLGLPVSGTVDIRTYRFDWSGAMGKMGAPVDLGVFRHEYSNDQVTFFVAPATAETAYAFEINV